jgi:hypothetical protein
MSIYRNKKDKKKVYQRFQRVCIKTILERFKSTIISIKVQEVLYSYFSLASVKPDIWY